MDFEWTKGHWLVIFSETPLWLVLLISLAVTLPVGMGRISFLLALLFVPLLRTARFIRARIGVDNGTLLLRAGWLFRKEERISAAFVTGVELNQNLLLRPWGIWQVRISFLGAAFRPVFALPRDQADTLLCLLLGKKGSRGSACKASKREFIRWGLFQPRTVKITALLTPFLAAISALLRLLSRQTLAPQDYEAALRVIFYLALLGGVLLGLYLLGSLVSLLYKLIIYYRFRVTSYDRLLHAAKTGILVLKKLDHRHAPNPIGLNAALRILYRPTDRPGIRWIPPDAAAVPHGAAGNARNSAASSALAAAPPAAFAAPGPIAAVFSLALAYLDFGRRNAYLRGAGSARVRRPGLLSVSCCVCRWCSSPPKRCCGRLARPHFDRWRRTFAEH